MKNRRINPKLLLPAALTVLAALIFLSCGPDEQGGTKVNWENYAIVVPTDGVRLDSSTAFVALRAGLKEVTGKDVEIRYENDEPVPNEILISCEREEFYEPGNCVRSGDALIRFTGEKFIVAAGSENGLLAETIGMLTEMISSESTVEEGEVYRKTGKYLYDSVTVNGTELNRYVIVLPSGREKNVYFDSSRYKSGHYSDVCYAALLTESRIEQLTGWKLRIIQAASYDPEKYPYAILFGSCGGISAGMKTPVEEYSYYVKCDGKNVAFAACDTITGGLAVNDYLRRLLPTPEKITDTYDIALRKTDETGVRRLGRAYADGADTRVLTFCGDYFDSPSSGLGLSMYFDYYPDIMCLQETDIQYRHQFTDRSAGGADETIADRYTVSGSGPQVICWLNERYNETDKGTLKGQTSGGSFAYWASADDVFTGKKVLVVNVNLSEDETVRIAESEILQGFLDGIPEKFGDDTKVIIAGEWGIAGSDPATAAIRAKYRDAAETAETPATPYFGTYHDIGAEMTEKEPRDNVFFGEGVSAVSIIRLFVNASAAKSKWNHLPVVCDLKLG